MSVFTALSVFAAPSDCHELLCWLHTAWDSAGPPRKVQVSTVDGAHLLTDTCRTVFQTQVDTVMTDKYKKNVNYSSIHHNFGYCEFASKDITPIYGGIQLWT